MITKSFDLIYNSEYYDSIITVFSPNYQEDIGGGMPVKEILDIIDDREKIVTAVLNSPEIRYPPGRNEFEAGGIPVFSSPERCATALAHVLSKK